jgi:hypothetical protein
VVEVNIDNNPFAGKTLLDEYKADKQRAIQMQEAGDSGDQSRSGGA